MRKIASALIVTLALLNFSSAKAMGPLKSVYWYCYDAEVMTEMAKLAEPEFSRAMNMAIADRQCGAPLSPRRPFIAALLQVMTKVKDKKGYEFLIVKMQMINLSGPAATEIIIYSAYRIPGKPKSQKPKKDQEI